MDKPTQEELEAQLATLQRQVEALQQQLTATQSVDLHQSGSGGMTQGTGTKAGGAGSVVADQIHGNVYVGKPPQDEREALAIYCQFYVATYHKLSLRGVYVGASDPTVEQKSLDLDQIYVALDTTGRRSSFDAREERCSVLQATIEHPRLVLLGSPGSGKSTFLNHLGLCLALHSYKPTAGWLKRLPGWPISDATLLPITVLLRDFARTIPIHPSPATPQHLWQFITSQLQSQNLDFANDLLHTALDRGKALILLDGLDEIPMQAQRIWVRNSIVAFATRYQKSRILVTCRTFSYQNAEEWLSEFSFVEIAPFDDKKIADFIKTWYQELARLNVVSQQKADQFTEQLQEDIRRPELRPLAANPLLLTVMALVNTHKDRLPDARALLYEETIDILLSRWDEIRVATGADEPTLRHLLRECGRTDVDLKRVLWRLAYTVQAKMGGQANEGLADIDELTLQRALAELHPTKSRDWAYQLIQAIKLRAGLLLERVPEVYTFPHRTFQEYLAGAHLAVESQFERVASNLAVDGAIWQQVILWAVGRLVYLSGDTAKPLALGWELCPQRPPASDIEWRKVWLAGEVLLEIGLNRVQDSELGRILLVRVRERLVELLVTNVLTAHERATVADILVRLGDPRFDKDVWFLPTEPLLGFVEIPTKCHPANESANKADRLLHDVTLPTYYVARYPVTVAQFRTFCEATAYQPQDPASLRDPPTRPVRYVTWHEASRYCRWLTETLRSWPGTPDPLASLLRVGINGSTPWCITLPSEAEWEKAARGDDGRYYPWGNEPNPERANCKETGLRNTSTVGCLAGGSPYGCLDMVGNVWEWTRSLWGENYMKPAFDYSYDPTDDHEDLKAPDNVLRVLCGGGWVDPIDVVGCGARIWVNPYYRSSFYGFRVVASQPNSSR